MHNNFDENFFKFLSNLIIAGGNCFNRTEEERDNCNRN